MNIYPDININIKILQKKILLIYYTTRMHNEVITVINIYICVYIYVCVYIYIYIYIYNSMTKQAYS